MNPLNILLLVIGGIVLSAFLYAAIVSVMEREILAAKRFVGISLLSLPYFVIGLTSFANQNVVSMALVVLTVFIVILLVIPFGRKEVDEDDTPKTRIDERDIMFSRQRYVVGTERYLEYYKRNPDKETIDNKWRMKPGFLKPGTAYYDTFMFSSAVASFSAVEQLYSIVDGEPSQIKTDVNAEKITTYIKHWAQKLGAISVGVTKLQDYHLYTHIGRGDDYGKTVDLKHKYAIAFTVEMDKFMLDAAPYGPAVMESARQYLNAGAIASQVAWFIRNQGYPARAHIDGNYRVVCPLVSRDAGLGEIGRMGLLMTPELGPRVRLSVVTTDLPLITVQRLNDNTITDFCLNCKKCAEVCPSSAISFEDKKEIDGVKRWQINSEACFTFWRQAGTDCGRCVIVCPYSHPDNLLHNIVRKGIKNSSLFRKFAIRMDDVIYGKKPQIKELPHWMKTNN